MSDLDSIVINLKACLVSTKGGIPLNQIESDYFKLNGEKIPYRNLGFSSLEALLQSSGKFTIQNYGGVSIVQALATNKTQHLTDLIKRQKSKPPKKRPFIGIKAAPRKFNTSNTYSRPNHYSRPGNGSSYGPPKNSFQPSSIPNSTSIRKTFSSHSNSRSNQYNNYQPKSLGENIYKKPQPLMNNYNDNINDQRNYQANNSDVHLPETKTLPQTYSFNDYSKNDIMSVQTSNVIYPLNGQSFNNQEKHVPLTSSCSSLESAYSSSSTGCTYNFPISKNSQDKFQRENLVNSIASEAVNKNFKDNIPKNNVYNQERNSELKSSAQHISAGKLPLLQNMSIKPSTAQSRLQKYPKKCDEPSINTKIDDKEKTNSQSVEPSSQTTNGPTETDDAYKEELEGIFIDELAAYLNDLNLSEPYYECMVKKEKSGKTIKHTHICTIKVNEKSISSSFPVECSTIDGAKKVAAKHALNVLKKQYGEYAAYPITSDINTMASRIKEFLKSGYEETGLMGDVLESIYRKKFKENLPRNWVQLLEVYSYFTFDKLVANNIIIYLNDITNGDQNSHGDFNRCSEVTVEEQNIILGTPLEFENYEEKSVLVSANYGSTSVWIRLVGQSADESFIQMQAKFNDTMNTGFSIAEQVTEGEFYAVLYNSSWHRIQVSSTTEEDGTILCFMIDTGEQLSIYKDQICCIEPVFMKTKAQAIECALTQLDNFGTFDGLKELLDEMILNKTFLLIPDKIEDGFTTKVTLYEKGGSVRVNINNKIVQLFLDKTVAKLPSFEENAIVDGIVSSIVQTGHLYLQLNFDVISSLEDILPNDEYLVPELFLKNKEDIIKDDIYLTKYEADNIWSRVQVLEIINDSEAKIIYIDYGNIANCEITKLVNLKAFDPLMSKIPPQAIKVTMNLLPPSVMTPEIANKIFEIIGSDPVLVNVVNVHTCGVPCIQVYKIQPDTPEVPLCINIQLAQSFKKQ